MPPPPLNIPLPLLVSLPQCIFPALAVCQCSSLSISSSLPLSPFQHTWGEWGASFQEAAPPSPAAHPTHHRSRDVCKPLPSQEGRILKLHITNFKNKLTDLCGNCLLQTTSKTVFVAQIWRSCWQWSRSLSGASMRAPHTTEHGRVVRLEGYGSPFAPDIPG